MGIDFSELQRMERASVQTFPEADGNFGTFLLSLVAVGNGLQPWGTVPALRDKQLREFYPTEPWLSGTVGSLAQRNAAFSWTLEGPARTVKKYQDILHFSDYGRGWMSLIQKVSIDLFTQDNGAFIEVIRDGDSPAAPLLGLGHLDAGQCVRTGNLEYPVVYTDRDGVQHKLSWWQVIPITDAPSPIEKMNGVGMCAVSRLLLYAQITYAGLIYEWEKTSGRNPGSLHVVSGVATDKLEQALRSAGANANNRGLTTYQMPAILGTLDPSAEVKLVTIALKSLPDGYSREEEHKWYVAVMAQAFGVEYQDIAPLPGGGLGTSTQSQTLHLKAKGKGPEWFRKTIEHRLNWFVLPENVEFQYTEEDYEAEGIEAGVKKTRAETHKIYFDIGMPPAVIWQLMQDDGDLPAEYLDMLQQQDVTPDVTGGDEERVETPEDVAQDATVSDDQQAPTAAPVPARPPVPGQQPQPTGALAAKVSQLIDDNYWDRQRAKLEQEYTADLTATLAELGQEFERMLRRAERESA